MMGVRLTPELAVAEAVADGERNAASAFALKSYTPPHTITADSKQTAEVHAH